jgi:hypothetical protein
MIGAGPGGLTARPAFFSLVTPAEADAQKNGFTKVHEFRIPAFAGMT